MATISSPGIGSGLDIKSIVSQLVALEKAPLTKLQAKEAAVQAKISIYGQAKSLVSALSDAASKLASLTGWNAVTATSSDATFVTASAVGGTLPGSFNVQVQALAQAQSTSSALVAPAGAAVGAGTLTLTLGTWNAGGTVFTAGAATPVNLTITAADTVASVASKINGANAGVSATVLTDATGDRLLLTGKNTGAAAGFQLTGTSPLAAGQVYTQYAQDARATVNGMAVTSTTNTFANTVAGVTFTAQKVTTGPIGITIAKDTSAVQANIQAFVKAYNDVNKFLNDATKYDPATKTAGPLQGDTAAITLQGSLRNAMQAVTSGSTVFTRLSDIGVGQLRGGDLTVDSTKLTAALNNMTELKNMFSNAVTGGGAGIAVRVKNIAADMLSSSGFFTSKDGSLKRQLTLNAKDVTRVNERVARVEAQLNQRYSALDSKVASLNALSSYVNQQITTWNNTTTKI